MVLPRSIPHLANKQIVLVRLIFSQIIESDIQYVSISNASSISEVPITLPPRIAARISAVHNVLSELPLIADSILSISPEWLRVRLFKLMASPRSMLPLDDAF